MLRARRLCLVRVASAQRARSATPAVCVLRGHNSNIGQGTTSMMAFPSPARALRQASLRGLSSGSVAAEGTEPSPEGMLEDMPEHAAAVAGDAVPFAQVLDEVAGMRNDTNRLVRLTGIISRCKQEGEWVNLLQLGLFLLSSPHYFCHHSCMLVAAALCTSPYSSEALSYMQELAARGIQPHPGGVTKVLRDLVQLEDQEALGDAFVALAEQNVFILSDVIEYTYGLCLKKENYAAARRLLRIIEENGTNMQIRKTYIYTLRYDKSSKEALGRFDQMRAMNVIPTALFASHYLSIGETDRAAQALGSAVLTDLSFRARDSVLVDVARALLEEDANQFIGHREQNELERFMWSTVRQTPQPGDTIVSSVNAFESLMTLWGKVGDNVLISSDAAPAGPASAVEERGEELGALDGDSDPMSRAGLGDADARSLHEACHRRRLEVLYDMLQSGVTPRSASFRRALGLKPVPATATAHSDEVAVKEVRELNRRGAFRSLAGLWAGVMVARDIETAPMALLHELLRDNTEPALNDTHLLLNRLGCPVLRKKLLVGKDNRVLYELDANGKEREKYRYDIEQFPDLILQHAWATLLSEFSLAGKIRQSPESYDSRAIGQHFDLDSRPLVFLRNVQKQMWFYKGEPKTPPNWFLDCSKRTNRNPMILAEGFKSILSYYHNDGDSASFKEIANYVIDNKYYNLQCLHFLREHCKEMKQPGKFYGIMVELASGMTEDSAKTPYAARVLSDFKAASYHFSAAGLPEQWAGSLDRHGPHVMLDGFFRDTVTHLVARLSDNSAKMSTPYHGVTKAVLRANMKEGWAERERIMDALATVVVAQTTCGLTCNWAELASSMSHVFMPPGYITNTYRVRVLNFGKLIQFPEHFFRRESLTLMLSHFHKVGYSVGIEEVWASCQPALLCIPDHAANILAIKRRRASGYLNDEATNKWIVDAFETFILSRGILFANQLLMQENALPTYFKSHLDLVCRPHVHEVTEQTAGEAGAETGTAAAQAAVSLELERFGRVVARLSDLGATLNIANLNAMSRLFEAENFDEKTQNVALWTMFLYVEKAVEDLEKLPPHSVPVPLGGDCTAQIADILDTFNKITIKTRQSRSRFTKHPPSYLVGEARTPPMESVYPPGHQSARQRHELRNALSGVVDKLVWAISPKGDQDLYMRFCTCQARIARMGVGRN
jgi:hypothetical protein